MTDKIKEFEMLLKERWKGHLDNIEKGSNEFDERNECERILTAYQEFFKEELKCHKGK